LSSSSSPRRRRSASASESGVAAAVGDVGEPHQPRPVAVGAGGGVLDRQPGLPDARRAGHGHQPVPGYELGEQGEVTVSAEK
jgi:hypothetical protein